MLAPKIHPAPKSTKHHGRAQVVTRGRAHETQVLNLSNAEAREWAMSGVHAHDKAGPEFHTPPVPDTPPADSFGSESGSRPSGSPQYPCRPRPPTSMSPTRGTPCPP